MKNNIRRMKSLKTQLLVKISVIKTNELQNYITYIYILVFQKK